MNVLRLNFKKGLAVCMLIVLSIALQAQTATEPTGDGSKLNPRQIATLNNLYWLTQNPGSWDEYYIQTANIDASSSSSWDSGKGLYPIGDRTTKFTGTYNGKGHTIKGLYIHRTAQDSVALFGIVNGVSASIDSLGVINAHVVGNILVGSIVAILDEGTLRDSYCTTLETDSIAGSNGIGGCVGQAYNGTVSNCYSFCNAYGSDVTGGFIARTTDATITNCYSIGKIKGSIAEGGGFTGGGAGLSNCFWDVDASGEDSGVGSQVIGYSTTEMKTDTTYTKKGWDFANETPNGTANIWGINSKFNNGYPFLTWQWEGAIFDVETLPDVTVEVNKEVTKPTATGLTNNKIYGEPKTGSNVFTTTGTKTITWVYTDEKGMTKEQTQTVIVKTATGIEKEEKNSFTVYPNPVYDALYLKSGNMQVQSMIIFDILGKVVIQKENVKDNEAIDVSGLSKGVYIVNCKSGKKTATYKIVKK